MDMEQLEIHPNVDYTLKETEALHTQNIPTAYREMVTDACRHLLAHYTDTQAIVLIGSVATGDFVPESDVDVLCVKETSVRFKEQGEIQAQLDKKVQLIFFDVARFKEHFVQRTTMAHSVARGMVLYEKEGFLQPFFKEPLGLPTHEWMGGWFVHWLRFYEYGMQDMRRAEAWHRERCGTECTCYISDNLARAVVNFAILFLETQGVVPTSKRQIQSGFQEKVIDGRLNVALTLALTISRQERSMDYQEGVQLKHLADWQHERLLASLNPTEEALEEIRRLRKLLDDIEKTPEFGSDKPSEGLEPSEG